MKTSKILAALRAAVTVQARSFAAARALSMMPHASPAPSSLLKHL